MEEKKLKVSSKESGQKQKLSYDELNNACSQLYQQNQVLSRQVQQLNMTNMFKRLDYLFMVLQHESMFTDREFVNSCIQEIQEALTIETSENTEE